MYDKLGAPTLFPLEDLLGWIDAVGPEHTVLGSDLGQQGNPLPMEVYRSIVPKLLDAGVPEADLKQILQVNTAFLLGLD